MDPCYFFDMFVALSMQLYRSVGIIQTRVILIQTTIYNQCQVELNLCFSTLVTSLHNRHEQITRDLYLARY